MLQAVLNGKAGRTQSDAGEAASWRGLYQTREDLLTSSVVGRLRYLPERLMWSIVRDVATPPGILPSDPGPLNSTQFWPQFVTEGSQSSYVEPDVVLEFENLIVIVEAKRWDGGGQNARQWALEWIEVVRAYREEDVAPDMRFVLLGLGGFPMDDRPGASFHSFCISVQAMIDDLAFDEELPRLSGVRIDWERFAHRIHEEAMKWQGLVGGEAILAVLSDITEALGLSGFRQIEWLKDMHRLNPPLPADAAETLSRLWPLKDRGV